MTCPFGVKTNTRRPSRSDVIVSTNSRALKTSMNSFCQDCMFFNQATCRNDASTFSSVPLSAAAAAMSSASSLSNAFKSTSRPS